ncbi:MAG: nucleotidyltransferase domain-containing protein [Patescibacteria group bacterium]
MKSDQVISTIKPILLKYGVTKSDLFGSFARGDYNDQSDVDVLINAPDGMSLFDLIHLKNDLEKNLKREVDVVTYDSVNKYVKKYIFQNMLPVL